MKINKGDRYGSPRIDLNRGTVKSWNNSDRKINAKIK